MTILERVKNGVFALFQQPDNAGEGVFKPKSYFEEYNGWNGANLVPFDGEKTPYELGTPIDYRLDYYGLRVRAWGAFLQRDAVQNSIEKYCLWIVGSGLKLQADPQETILNNEGINFDKEGFISKVESYFRVYVKLKESTYSEEMNLHTLASEVLKNALLAGDVLLIQRYVNGKVKMEMVDGYYIQSPVNMDEFDKARSRGNIIKDGVEVDKKGTHIAYYIQNSSFGHDRIPAVAEKTRRRQAWLFYGRRYKQESIRGMSLLSAVLETVAKVDRYKDASLGSAEENSKVPYVITHNQFSDGENPLINQLVQSQGKRAGTAPETDSYEVCNDVATKIAQTTEKMTYNMPIGSDLKRNNFETDLNFSDFFNTNIDVVYATLGIPPEVATDKFGGSYSSSRAALKSWEYKMATDRINKMEEQFYKPFYNFWLDMFILENKIDVGAYLEAFFSDDYMVLAAFRNCRFIGATVPHIDPVKEVTAERLKLGDNFKEVPLTTAEQSCENLNTGDHNAIINKTKTEMQQASEFIKTKKEGD
jgi:hypothetical protein